MRRLGLILSLVIAMLGGTGARAWVGPASHCARPAIAGHQGAHAALAKDASAGGTLGAAADCAHCPLDQCAASSACTGGPSPQLAAPQPTFAIRPATGPACAVQFVKVRSTSSSPPTPPPQALA